MFNKTKIIATIGPASRSQSEMRAMISAGADVFRINGSYEDPAHHAKTTSTIRSAAARERTSTAVLVDLPGPKFRLGQLEPNEYSLKSGSTVTLACGRKTQKNDLIPVPDMTIARSVKPGNTVFINDGIVALRVLEVKGSIITCKVKAGGPIRSGKGLNLPRVELKLPSLTKRDRELAHMAIKEDVDYVGLSFVRSASNIKALRAIFRKKADHIRIVAKIEKPEALDDLDNIIDAADAIMVARGDLGIEMPFDQIPLIQRHILRRCMAAGKPAITATQMLESMVSSSRPTRAEATDVAQAVWEGTDAVMLSEETSVGVNPARAVRAMAHIAHEAEREMPDFMGIEGVSNRHEYQAYAISRAAYFLANELQARAIVTPTRSGRTPLYVSRARPGMITIAPTGGERTARRMSLYWGVVPMHMPSFKTVDEMLEAAEASARKSRFIKKGDTVVITSGAHGESDDITRLVEVRTV
jgi:pyruvate kinase